MEHNIATVNPAEPKLWALASGILQYDAASHRSN
jgi:hypothetical protein